MYKVQVHVDKGSPRKIDTLKLIEEKVQKSLEYMGTGKNFWNRTPMAYVLRSRIDKWNLMKLQKVCKAKGTVNNRKLFVYS